MFMTLAPQLYFIFVFSRIYYRPPAAVLLDQDQLKADLNIPSPIGSRMDTRS